MEKRQLGLIVGVALVVAIIASVATVSITGNAISVAKGSAGKVYTVSETYSKKQIDGFLKPLAQTSEMKAIVADMLDKQYKDCAMSGEESWDDNCQNICKGYGKKCLLGQYFIENYGGRGVPVQRVVGCNEVPGSYYANSTEIPSESDSGQWCLCC